MSSIAQSAHLLPHVTMQGTLIDGTFMRPDPMTYITSVAVLPLVILALCIVSLIFYLFGLLLRCFCYRCKCKPKTVPFDEKEVTVLISRRRYKIVAFIIFLVILVLANHLTFYGLAQLNSGVSHIVKAINTLSDNFDSLKVAVDGMTATSSTLSVTMSLVTSQCNGADTSSSIAAMTSGLSSLSSLSSIPGPALDMFSLYISEYLLEKKDMVYYIIYAIFMVIAALYALAYFIRSTILMKLLVFISWILTLVLTLVYSIEWIFITIMGDLCFNVTESILNYLQSGTMYNLLNYYINCAGINPFKKPFDSVDNSLEVFSATLSNVAAYQGQTCQYLGEAQSQVQLMRDGLKKILSVFDCAPFSNAWTEFVEVGICTDTLGGFFILWISHIGIAWGICMSMFLGSLVWQYFEDKYWYLNSVQPYDDEEGGGPSFSIVPDDNVYTDDKD